MKSFLMVIALFATVFMSNIAQAEWTGTQILAVGALDNVKLSDDGSYAFRASVHQFFQPASGTSQTFAYVGPRLNISDTLWFSPQVGSAMGWAPDGGDAVIVSTWIGVSPLPRVSLFFESDLYFYDGTYDYYGFYFLDYALLKQLSIGPTLEHVVDQDTILGPHATLYTEAGPWISTQYCITATSQFEHTVRFVVGLFF